MRGGRDGNRKTSEQRHAAVESEKLRGDLALVVVHGDDRVVIAAAGGDENSVGRERSSGCDSLRAGPFNAGTNFTDLLGSEQSSFSRVRIETRDRDALRR